MCFIFVWFSSMNSMQILFEWQCMYMVNGLKFDRNLAQTDEKWNSHISMLSWYSHFMRQKCVKSILNRSPFIFVSLLRDIIKLLFICWCIGVCMCECVSRFLCLMYVRLKYKRVLLVWMDLCIVSKRNRNEMNLPAKKWAMEFTYRTTQIALKMAVIRKSKFSLKKSPFRSFRFLFLSWQCQFVFVSDYLWNWKLGAKIRLK